MLGVFKPHITENTKHNDAIKEILLNNVVEGLIVSEDTGDIVYANELGKAIMESGVFGPIDIVSRNPKTFSFNGREYKATYDRIPDSVDIRGVIATLVDTAGAKEQAQELEDVKEKLAKATGFKTAFLANMSHEIRTPIHAIIGFAEIIMKQNIDDNVRKQIEMIKDSSYSLLAIINDVLDLSKIESGKMELVCSNYYISYVIRDIEATFSLLASRKGLKFNMHLDDNIPSNMYGDKIRLRGTLLNVLNNAVKYTKEGHIDFYIKVLEKKEGVATLSFVVRDTGIGIKKEDLEHIFESFSRFDIQNNYSVEGRGLGLSIAKGYMDLMGGKIEVESEYGVGSTFTITVDQKIIDDSPVDMNIVYARKKTKNKVFTIKDYRALVVDDNPVNLTVANGLMQTYGLNVDKASGGKEAISLCMENEYDIIFMDQMMPEVDGVKAMKEIRKISEFYNNDSIIIVLTADAMAGVKDRLIKEGFNEYLSKPLEVHRLEEMLLKFVPQENIVDKYHDEDVKGNIIIEQGNAVETKEVSNQTQIEDIAGKLGIPIDVFNKKIKDCGGSIEDYKASCELAIKNSDARIRKIRESQASGDYERYTIEAHALKTTLVSLGQTELANRAKDQELAGKERRFDYIDANMESLINDYEAFIQKLKLVILNTDDSVMKAKASGKGEEWSKEELSQLAVRMLGLADEFNFGEIFAIFDNIARMEKGPKTKAILDDLESIMNEMDIDTLKRRLGELIS